MRDVFRDGWYFIFVIILLVVLLLVMKRENWAPWLATGLLIVLNQALLRQPLGLERSCSAFIEGNGRVFVELVAILAGIGLLVGAFSLTGLTGTLTTELLYIAGDQPLLLMLMGAI